MRASGARGARKRNEDVGVEKCMCPNTKELFHDGSRRKMRCGGIFVICELGSVISDEREDPPITNTLNNVTIVFITG